MTAVIEATGLSKRYRSTLALEGVDVALEQNTVYGLLGRNGAGKTTLMSILTAQNIATAGRVRVFGENPYENARALSRMCFVRESQRYPDDATPEHAFRIARLFFRDWDEPFARRLVGDFRLPLDRRIKKLSRGQLSAVGIVIGLASRAEITFFDEPYLGLDAVARQLFYDRLLEDYAERPRTIVLSSHLIDEVADLLERVIVVDEGRIIMEDSTETARSAATNLVGDAESVERFAAGHEVIHREHLGRTTSATVLGAFTPAQQQAMRAAGIERGPVSLQQLIVRRTQRGTVSADRSADAPEGASA